MSFLQFFRRFIQDLFPFTTPVTYMTKKGEEIQKQDSGCGKAFESIKNTITSAPILVAPNWQKFFPRHVDASYTAVAGT